jgi:hypothetical protein
MAVVAGDNPSTMRWLVRRYVTQHKNGERVMDRRVLQQLVHGQWIDVPELVERHHVPGISED